jgi:type I restriction enzyme R subunit
MFNESNTVESFLRDQLVSPIRSVRFDRTGEQGVGYTNSRPGWRYVPPVDVPRRPQDVLVEPWVREALIRLNPAISAQPDRADDVLYKLRAIIMGVPCLSAKTASMSP